MGFVELLGKVFLAVTVSLSLFSAAGCGDDDDIADGGTDGGVDVVDDTTMATDVDASVADTVPDQNDIQADETADVARELDVVASDPAVWTVLVYLLADCDLEAFALTDLEEMAAVASSDDVNWVLQVDRAEDSAEGNYSDAGVLNLANWETAKRIVVEDGALVEVADLGEINMGDASTLTDFIEWGVNVFPADNYALILWDHGGAWMQFGPDDSDDDPMTLMEIRTGLEDGVTSTGIGQLDLLGFDACLMANIEVTYELRNLADVFVASEETEPGHGWGWTGLGEALNGNPSMTAAEFGQAIADTYMSHGQSVHPPGANGLTMSVIDLSAMQALGTAMNTAVIGLADVLDGGDGFNQLGYVRSRVEEYGTAPNPAENMGVVDLGDFLEIAADGHEEWATFITPVQTALDAAILHNRSGYAKPDATGLSIYYPAEADLDDSDLWDAYEATAWHTDTGWADFLTSYLTAANTDTVEPTLTDVSIDVTVATATLTAATTLDDLADVEAFLGEMVDTSVFAMGTQMLEPSEAGPDSYDLEYVWDYTWPYFTDGTNVALLPLFEVAVYQPYFYETCRLFMAPAEYRATPEAVDWIEVTLNFIWCYPNYGGQYAEYQQFAGAYFDATGTPAEIELEVGGQVRPVWIEMLDDGSEVWSPSEDPTDYISVTEDGFDFEYMDVPAGDYLLGFFVTDVAGNVGADWEGVTVSE